MIRLTGTGLRLLVSSWCLLSLVQSELASEFKKWQLDDNCTYWTHLEQDERINFSLLNLSQSCRIGQHCTLRITTAANHLVVLNLQYSPWHVTLVNPEVNCARDYLHVGNDLQFIDFGRPSTYFFCGQRSGSQELVSQGPQMWVVYNASRPAHLLELSFQALTRANCSKDEFRCSPVQCVPGSRICDGTKDCFNGFDEYCLTRASMNTRSRDGEWESCFRCSDASCILPSLPMYHPSYGHALWYLCDGTRHCQDGLDERKDMCKDVHRGRYAAVRECVPFDRMFGQNRSVVMWKEVNCDGSVDCFHGDDEKDCNNPASPFHKLRADPATLGAVSGILVAALVTICIIYRIKLTRASRPSTSSTVDTKCTLCNSDEARCVLNVAEDSSQRQSKTVSSTTCHPFIPVYSQISQSTRCHDKLTLASEPELESQILSCPQQMTA